MYVYVYVCVCVCMCVCVCACSDAPLDLRLKSNLLADLFTLVGKSTLHRGTCTCTYMYRIPVIFVLYVLLYIL